MDDAGLAQGSRAVLPARTASTTSRMESVTSCGLSWWIRWPLSVFVTCCGPAHERSEIRREQPSGHGQVTYPTSGGVSGVNRPSAIIPGTSGPHRAMSALNTTRGIGWSGGAASI